MVVGEFTASNIAMEEDKREEENNKKKKSTVDMAKLQADIDAQLAVAAQVRRLGADPCWAGLSQWCIQHGAQSDHTHHAPHVRLSWTLTCRASLSRHLRGC